LEAIEGLVRGGEGEEGGGRERLSLSAALSLDPSLKLTSSSVSTPNRTDTTEQVVTSLRGSTDMVVVAVSLD
jgi:ABC-type phosphate transport system ATPase subunit